MSNSANGTGQDEEAQVEQLQYGATTRSSPPSIWLGAFFVLTLIVLSLLIILPSYTGLLELALRATLAISLAGIASIIPGFIHLRFQEVIQAGGAISIFALVFLLNPPGTVRQFAPDFNLSGDYTFHLQTDDGELEGGNAHVNHEPRATLFAITGDVNPNERAPDGTYIETPRITFASSYALITPQQIIFHYRTNAGEEGVAVADYSGQPNTESGVFFNFRDFSGADEDGFASGILVFRRIKLQ